MDLDTPAQRATRSAKTARAAGYSISKDGPRRGLLDHPAPLIEKQDGSRRRDDRAQGAAGHRDQLVKVVGNTACGMPPAAHTSS